jgi:hypothetical protein
LIDEVKEVLKSKPTEVPPKSKTGWVEISMGKTGIRYAVNNAEKKTIAMPAKSYETKEEVLKVIESLKIALKSKPIDVKE